MSRKLVTGKHPVRPEGSPKGGAPTYFEADDKLIGKIRQAILLGAPVDTAAAFHGVSAQTVRLWVAKGHEDPNSRYGELLAIFKKAVAEWEVRDLAAWDAHIVGRPAEYVMEPVREKDGSLVYGDERDESGARKPLMQPSKDGNGNPILKRKAIEPDWKAAAERLARRKPRYWARQLNVNLDHDAPLTFDNRDRETKPAEALSFEQRIAEAVAKLEEDV